MVRYRYPLNLKVKVTDYSYDSQTIDDVVYKVAANNALRMALSAAKPVMMEPIMKVEVVVPPDYSGTIVSDINSRRGHISGSRFPWAFASCACQYTAFLFIWL